MYQLELPEYMLNDFFDEMLKGRHNNDKNKFLKTRLLAVKEFLISEEDKYKSLAEKSELHLLSEIEKIEIPGNIELIEGIPKIVTSDEMEKVYTNFLADSPDSEKIGRSVYDSILSNTNYSLCPYCSHRDVSTVDHFLPKSKFISYAVTPINLLPSCSDCNKNKLDTYMLEEDKFLVHPYFEDVDEEDWLKSEVVEGLWPITFTYIVREEMNNATLKSRLESQFELLRLGKLYADNAAREFRKRVKSLIKEYESNEEGKALYFLNDNIDSYSAENKNSWQTKMYEALKESRWFVDEALPLLKSKY